MQEIRAHVKQPSLMENIGDVLSVLFALLICLFFI